MFNYKHINRLYKNVDKTIIKIQKKISTVFNLRDFQLHTDFFWKFNETNNVAKCGFNNDPVVFDKYEGRVEVFGQNYSLLLKNVQHSDSGDYTAVVVGGQEQRVAQYKVVVQGRSLFSFSFLSPVNLTVDSVSSGSDSCSLIVTCSTVDYHISSIFTCDAQNCSLVDRGSFKAKTYSSNLVVYLQQDFIVCNHSNQVSVEQTKEIKLYCKEKPGKIQRHHIHLYILQNHVLTLWWDSCNQS
uniref:Immunoglobulin subtype domain-containing protein n=1 Tax=Oreochromis niloticus TaxID=8128 RepID=A0A669CCH2_ORENI